MPNVLLAGVGGQGTVLASKLIAYAAIEQGIGVKTAETIGMAQRGGTVVSHVRLGDDVYSPLIALGEADLLIGFEPGEAVRAFSYLKKTGTVIAAKQAVVPVTASLSGFRYRSEDMVDFLRKKAERLILVDTEMLCKECGSPKVANVILLGAAAAGGVLGIGLSQIEKTIQQKVPQKYLDVNLKALSLGAKAI